MITCVATENLASHDNRECWTWTATWHKCFECYDTPSTH